MDEPENNPPLPLRRRRLAAVPPAPAPASAADVQVLLRVATSCPRCGTRPALRVTQAMVRALAGAEAGVRLGTYQCQRRGCGAIYDLEAGAYLRAG
jgi:hypothetical protein